MCSCKRLFLWVEGNDDERFFERAIIPKIKEKYNTVQIIKYATMKREKTDNFIKSIEAMGADYIYFADINNSHSIMDKKEKIQLMHKYIDPNKIIIVIKEIESWYLAGLNNKACNQLKIDNIETTDNITKEKFNTLIPKKFTSRIDFMLEILKIFSIKEAKLKNKSFKYFIEKYNCQNS